MAIEVLAVRSLDALPTPFWSSFHRAGGVYQTRPWLEFVEWSAGPAVAYVQATDADPALRPETELSDGWLGGDSHG